MAKSHWDKYVQPEPVTPPPSADDEARARELAQEIVIAAAKDAGYRDSTGLDPLFRHHLTERMTATLSRQRAVEVVKAKRDEWRARVHNGLPASYAVTALNEIIDVLETK